MEEEHIMLPPTQLPCQTLDLRDMDIALFTHSLVLSSEFMVAQSLEFHL